MSKKIKEILRKKNKTKIVSLTAYSKNVAKILDKHCDIILVGDSVATAFYGMKNTRLISFETIINHSISVSKAIKKSTLVIDMPFKTYRNYSLAKKNVKKIFKKTNCDAIKIESNGKNSSIIAKLVKSGYPVMGHIGFTPQFKKKFQPQGMSLKDEKKLIVESLKIEKAGAFSLVLECVSESVAKKITKILRIPTIGIGSSKFCDGQILVTDDLIGISGFYPKFVKKYLNLDNILNKAIKRFKQDVIKNRFPKKINAY